MPKRTSYEAELLHGSTSSDLPPYIPLLLYSMHPATTAAIASAPPIVPILLLLAPLTGTAGEGVEAGIEPVGAAAPDDIEADQDASVTTVKGFSLQDIVGSAERVTMSGVEE